MTYNQFQVSLGLLLIAILTPLYFVTPEGSSSLIIWSCLVIYYVFLIRALLTPVRIHPLIPTYASIEVLFLLFYLLVFFLPYQYSVLGLTNLYANKFLSHAFVMQTNQAVVAATIGLVGFCTGIRLVSFKSNTERLGLRHPSQDLIGYGGLYSTILILQSGLIALYQIAGWRSADEGRYTGSISGGVLASGVYTLIIMLCIMSIAVFINHLARRRPIPSIVWCAFAITALWGLRILLAGDRNNFFLLAIAAGGGLMTFRFKANLLILGAGVVAALFVYNGIEAFRMLTDKNFDALLQGMFYGERGDLASGSFSITTATLRASVAVVPTSEPFGWGWYKLIGFSGVVPFVRGLVLSDYSGFLSTSDLLTYRMIGPGAGWSVGSNVISDIFIDFGIIGVAVLMTLLGLSAGGIQYIAAKDFGSVPGSIIYLVALPLYAELPRYSLDFPVRMLAWALIILVLHRFLALMRPKVRQPLKPPLGALGKFEIRPMPVVASSAKPLSEPKAPE